MAKFFSFVVTGDWVPWNACPTKEISVNTYEVTGYVPGVGNIGIVIVAQNESAAGAAFRAQYPNGQVSVVRKISGS